MNNNQVLDKNFELFLAHSLKFAMGKGYQVKDANLYRSLMHDFFYSAQQEYEKICKKIELDSKYKI